MPSFAAYLCLLLSVFVVFGQALPISQSIPTRNILRFNSSEVRYSTNQWDVVSPLSSQPSPSFTSSNDIGASFGVMLPSGTIGVDYVAMPRTSGAAYAVCIDCSLLDNTKGKWSLVNGNDPTLASEDQAKPTVLFSVADLDPTVTHSLTVTNIPDTRFSNSSQITFESLNIKIVDNSAVTKTESSPETTQPAPSASGSSTTSEPISTTSSNSVPTNSATDSGSLSSPTATSVSAVFPTASGLPDSSLIKVSAAQPSPSATHGAADSSELKTQQIYQTVVALVAVFCIFSFFCLVAALVFVFHTRRKRALTKLRDAESQAYDNSQWLTPNHIVPFTGLQEVPLSGAPQRPKNPFADQFPPNVPLELETPSESTLVNKRGDRDVRRPRSSFGNGLYDYYVPRR